MDRLRHAIETCVIAPGDQLPGIRVLAQQLVISPNTVIKAYAELEREGVIEIRHGSGAFVTDRESGRDRGKEVRTVKNLVRSLVEKLRGLGFSDDEIRRFVQAELDVAPEEIRIGR